MGLRDRWYPGRSTPIPTREASAIVFRESSGVQSVEDRLLLNGNYETAEIAEAADEITWAVFGLKRRDCDGWLSRLRSVNQSDADVARDLLSRGLDLRAMDGAPLLCTRLVAVQAEAAARKFGGRMPTPKVLNDNKWESELEAAAAAFLAKKRKRA